MRRTPDPGRRPRCSGGGDPDVDLAERDLLAVAGRELHDQLTVAVTRRLVADIGGDDATVGQEAAAVVLGVVGAFCRWAPAWRPPWP